MDNELSELSYKIYNELSSYKILEIIKNIENNKIESENKTNSDNKKFKEDILNHLSDEIKIFDL